LAVSDDLGPRHRPVLLEQGQQVVGRGVPRQVADVDILRHRKKPFRAWSPEDHWRRPERARTTKGPLPRPLSSRTRDHGAEPVGRRGTARTTRSDQDIRGKSASEPWPGATLSRAIQKVSGEKSRSFRPHAANGTRSGERTRTEPLTDRALSRETTHQP